MILCFDLESLTHAAHSVRKAHGRRKLPNLYDVRAFYSIDVGGRYSCRSVRDQALIKVCVDGQTLSVKTRNDWTLGLGGGLIRLTSMLGLHKRIVVRIFIA